MTARFSTLAALLFFSLARAEEAPGIQTMEFTVDGAARTALVYAPPGEHKEKMPLVFAFHGHGGTSKNALHQFGFDHSWPEAISVYPQGLNTVGQLTDPEGKRSGWQHAVANDGDRDLHFFDALLERLKTTFPVDPARIYVTGHSNGGGFTYLLWLARPDIFAAVAPCSSAAIFGHELKPKTAMISGGKTDPLVKFEWQQMMMDGIRKINGCEGDGAPWESAATLFPSKTGTPLVTYAYDGGHGMSPDEAALIAKFFKELPGVNAPK